MIKKEIFIGLLSGLIATILGTFLYITLFSKLSIKATLETATQQNILGGIIALGAIANFLPFFVFLKKKQDYRARGVLIVSLCIAITVAFLKFY